MTNHALGVLAGTTPIAPDVMYGPEVLALAAAIGLALHAALYGAVLAVLKRRERAAEGTENSEGRAAIAEAVRRTRTPAGFVAPLAAMLLAFPIVGLGNVTESQSVRRLLVILLIAASTWLLSRVVTSLVQALLSRYDLDVRDNLRARKIHTQWRVITRIVVALVWIMGTAAALMTIPGIRELGASLLASAGLAGLVIGLAAQRTIGNFIAGLQIAITQPLRLDDAVVVAGEWGWVEEITATYVVVRIWDERRLIVPFSTLLEQPFQNWTRSDANLIGAVVLWTDYTVPVQALREELQRVVRANDLWDGRVAVLQVIDATERGLQLRALVSAADSPSAWDLRCDVREKLIAFVQRQYPQALPRMRAHVLRHEPVAATERLPADDRVETGGLPGAPSAVTADGHGVG